MFKLKIYPNLFLNIFKLIKKPILLVLPSPLSRLKKQNFRIMEKTELTSNRIENPRALSHCDQVRVVQ